MGRDSYREGSYLEGLERLKGLMHCRGKNMVTAKDGQEHYDAQNDRLYRSICTADGAPCREEYMFRAAPPLSFKWPDEESSLCYCTLDVEAELACLRKYRKDL